MAYAEHIPNQDPLTSEDEQERQAGIAFARMSRGRTADEVAEELGISRRMVYYRLRKLISAQIPGVDVVRLIHYGRLEAMFAGLEDRAAGASNADYARLRGEQRQVLARQSALLRIEHADPEPPDDQPDEPDLWVDGARADADAVLAETERRLRGAP